MSFDSQVTMSGKNASKVDKKVARRLTRRALTPFVFGSAKIEFLETAVSDRGTRFEQTVKKEHGEIDGGDGGGGGAEGDGRRRGDDLSL